MTARHWLMVAALCAAPALASATGITRDVDTTVITQHFGIESRDFTVSVPDVVTTGGGGSTAVPEPGTLVLALGGFAGLLLRRRRS